MNERKLRQLNIMLLIAVVMCVAVMALFAFGLAPDGQNRIHLNRLTRLDDTWVLQSMGTQGEILVDLPTKIKAEPGEVITISHTAPEDVSEDTVLFLRTEFQNIVVVVGGNRVYQDGVLNNQKLLKNAVPRYHVVPLSGAKPGEKIVIQLSSGYKRYSGQLGHIYYGSRGDVVSHMIRRDGVAFVVAVTMVVILALLGLSLLFVRHVEINKRKAGYGLGFIFCAALWALLDNSMLQLITKNQFGVYMCCNVLLLLMPLLYLMYLRCFALKRRYAKIFEIAIYVFGINLLTGVVFQLVGVCDFATYGIFTKILVAIGMIMLSGIMYLAADTYSDKTIYSTLWANVILTVGILGEFVLSFFKFYGNYHGLVLQIGLFIFAVLLMLSIEKALIQEMNEEREAAINSIGHEKTQAVRTINASWIYSALNVAIGSLKEKDAVNSRLIYDTSIFMQHNMQAVHKTSMVSFKEELDYIRAYLGMAKRVHAGLEVIIEDKIVDFKVPFNSVEPIVENAVINGALTAEGHGKIVIRSYERLDCFAIQIVDNGKGLGPAKKFTGVQSFKDIRKRLKNTSGAVIEIKNKPDKGTILTVKIPKEGYIIKE